MTLIICEKLSVVLQQLFLERLVVIVMILKKKCIESLFSKNPENMKFQVLLPK